MRKSTIYLALTACGIIALAMVLLLHPMFGVSQRGSIRTEAKVLVQRLGLTDLCIFTEARYTRHLSQADLHSAFQSHPMAFEHFPSGSLTLPPLRFRKSDLRSATDTHRQTQTYEKVKNKQ